MKKVLLSILLMLLPILANADPVEVDGIWYNLIPKGQVAEVTRNPSGENYTGDVTIPDEIIIDDEVYSVKKIVDCAFSYCNGLSSVIIPNSVESLGDMVFRNCSSLTSITIPNSVITIGDYTFEQCTTLSSVTIGSSVNSIGEYAFNECRKLTSVHISDIKAWCGIYFADIRSNPLLYAHHLYLNGEEIKDLVIPNSVSTICDRVFLGCSALTSVTIPNSVTTIGNMSFYECSDLTSVTIGNNVTSISYYAFYRCGLTSVTIPNSVKFIGTGAFHGCSRLTSVHIYDLEAWCGIDFSDGHDSNPLSNAQHLFLNGEEIKDLFIPNSVESIGNYAFCGCEGITSVTIPNSVKAVGNFAFQGCKALTIVSIPNSVKTIRGYAFAYCKQLTDVYSMAEQVRDNTSYDPGLCTDPSAFAGSYQEYITLHVPDASVDAYKAIEPWKSFKEVVALDGEEIPSIPKCATPTISLVDGKITFSCETEDVEFISEVTVSDAMMYYDAEISAPKKFKVSVYATKANYNNSDTATAEFDFSGDTSLSGDVDGNGIVNVADHVKLSSIIMNQYAQ